MFFVSAEILDFLNCCGSPLAPIHCCSPLQDRDRHNQHLMKEGPLLDRYWYCTLPCCHYRLEKALVHEEEKLSLFLQTQIQIQVNNIAYIALHKIELRYVTWLVQQTFNSSPGCTAFTIILKLNAIFNTYCIWHKRACVKKCNCQKF